MAVAAVTALGVVARRRAAAKADEGCCMSDEWRKEEGNAYGLNIVDALVDTATGGDRVCVTNDACEHREVDVLTGQTLGEAIANGQFHDKEWWNSK